MLTGATRPAGVTEEHLPGPKPGGFGRVAPVLFPDPIYDPNSGSQVSSLVNEIKGSGKGMCDLECDWRCDWGCNLITSSLLQAIAALFV